MTPGLALFYGGMTRSKNVLNMLNMNVYCMGIIPVLWVILGFTLAFGASVTPAGSAISTSSAPRTSRTSARRSRGTGFFEALTIPLVSSSSSSSPSR